VNVAARLEALAEPGSVLVSKTVYEHVRDRLPYAFEDLGEQHVKNIARPVRVRDKLPYRFEDMGEQSVKNIARPVRVYALRAEGVPDPLASNTPIARSASQAAEAPRLSIVVLPFTNLSDDREQQYFADGIIEDLTTDLSRIAGLFVISRNTAFTYRNKPVDTKRIGRELGVRYVLEGSVRRSGNQIRVNAQLIDAATDAHLWAERFDRDTADLFALQNEITSRLANALGVELIAAEAARPTEHPDALDYILRGRAVLLRPRTPDTHREAINLFEHALALDPQSVEARVRLANALVGQVLLGMTNSASAEPGIARAEELVDRALAASPRFALAHVAKGHGRWCCRQIP
jgi:TolB-like protein